MAGTPAPSCTNDFIELYQPDARRRGSLSGWSVQYGIGNRHHMAGDPAHRLDHGRAGTTSCRRRRARAARRRWPRPADAYRHDRDVGDGRRGRTRLQHDAARPGRARQAPRSRRPRRLHGTANCFGRPRRLPRLTNTTSAQRKAGGAQGHGEQQRRTSSSVRLIRTQAPIKRRPSRRHPARGRDGTSRGTRTCRSRSASR